MAEGGRLLVIDSGDEPVALTANSLLRPFGLEISYEQNWQGELALAGRGRGTPGRARLGGARRQRGGQPGPRADRRRRGPLRQGTRPGRGFRQPLQRRPHGHGLVARSGPAELLRYQALFALLRLLVEDQPMAAPQGEAKGENR